MSLSGVCYKISLLLKYREKVRVVTVSVACATKSLSYGEVVHRRWRSIVSVACATKSLSYFIVLDKAAAYKSQWRVLQNLSLTTGIKWWNSANQSQWRVLQNLSLT